MNADEQHLLSQIVWKCNESNWSLGYAADTFVAPDGFDVLL